MDEDVQLALRNQQRRQSKVTAIQEASNTGRRRTNLLNGLAQNLRNENVSIEVPMEENTSRSRQNSHSEVSIANTANNPLVRPRLVDRVQPAHNDHLPVRRSTRASGPPNKYFETSPERQEAKAKKYSVEVGLPDKWSRPLSYPKVGKKKTTVEWEDLVRLDDDEFLNDNLVSFYMRYLEQAFTENTPDLAKTVYFFNSFFYDRLTTTQKGQRGINYEGVQRWTRGVDLFAYDYVIVPINEMAHWYVAIVCNLPALDQKEDPSKEVSSPVNAVDIEQITVVDTSVTEEKQLEQADASMAEGHIPETQETEARNSFAEMSLDGTLHKRQASEDSLMGRPDTKETEEAVNADEDQEMLDVPNAVYSRIDSAKPIDLEKPTVIEDAEENQRPSTPGRKPKRKSLPPSITKLDPTSPVIITFDSFGHAHSSVIRILKQYLFEEGNAKRNTEFDVGRIKGITAKNIPQQSNFSDCGLYMLGYVEKFLDDHPKDFIGKIIKRDYNDRKDWPKMVPSNMRNSLREQLQRLHEEDEVERIASKNAKRASKPQEAEAKPPTEEKPKGAGEAAQDVQSEGKKDAASVPEGPETEEGVPMNAQQIRDATYHPSSTIQADQRRPSLESAENTKALEISSDPTLEDSLIEIDGNNHTSSTIKASPQEIPSSQAPQHPTSTEEVKSPSPGLPSEIEDSQPVYAQTAGLHTSSAAQVPNQNFEQSKDPEEYALSPDPSGLKPTEEETNPMTFEMEEKQEKNEDAGPQDMVYTDFRPPAEDKSRTSNDLSSPRSAKRGVAQRVQPPSKRQQQQQQQRGRKKEEAIELD